MKNGKKPTLAQRKLMEENRLNSNNWLVVKDTPEKLVLVSRNNASNHVNKEKVIMK